MPLSVSPGAGSKAKRRRRVCEAMSCQAMASGARSCGLASVAGSAEGSPIGGVEPSPAVLALHDVIGEEPDPGRLACLASPAGPAPHLEGPCAVLCRGKLRIGD